MNFCAAILLLKLEEKQHFWSVNALLFQKGKNATEMQKKSCAVYGEDTVTDGTCQKWFGKFLGTTDILAK